MRTKEFFWTTKNNVLASVLLFVFIVLPMQFLFWDGWNEFIEFNVGLGMLLWIVVNLARVKDLEDRLEQAVVVGDSLVAAIGPAVIGGDFNTGTRWEETLVRRVFRRFGFREAHILARKTARGGPLDLLGYDLKLDHIYYRDLEFIAAGVSGEATASDHLPVWSVFHWRD